MSNPAEPFVAAGDRAAAGRHAERLPAPRRRLCPGRRAFRTGGGAAGAAGAGGRRDARGGGVDRLHPFHPGAGARRRALHLAAPEGVAAVPGRGRFPAWQLRPWPDRGAAAGRPVGGEGGLFRVLPDPAGLAAGAGRHPPPGGRRHRHQWRRGLHRSRCPCARHPGDGPCPMAAPPPTRRCTTCISARWKRWRRLRTAPPRSPAWRLPGDHPAGWRGGVRGRSAVADRRRRVPAAWWPRWRPGMQGWRLLCWSATRCRRAPRRSAPASCRPAFTRFQQMQGIADSAATFAADIAAKAHGEADPVLVQAVAAESGPGAGMAGRCPWPGLAGARRLPLSRPQRASHACRA